MSNLPNFSRHEGHEFKDGEQIYVIDPNKYDIWAAEIQSVTDKGYKIHYPDYPDDDCLVEDASSFLVKDDVNTKIFKSQEKIRKQLEEKEDREDSDSDDYQQTKKKAPKKKKKEKPKKEKKPKEKKEKPPKEPKPKKEKPKKAKEGKFKKISGEKEYRKILHDSVKTAFQRNISDPDSFIEFFDNTYRPIYGDKQMNKISADAVQRFTRELARSQDNEIDGEEIIGDFGSDSYGEVSDHFEEEDIKFEQPEEITLPTIKGKIQNGYEISIGNTSLSFNKNDPFPILFEDERCNAFIYKTPATQYLILNGMKFELEQIDEDDSSPKQYFYDESKLPPHDNQQSVSYFYPKLMKLGIMKVKESPECIKYMEMQIKKKSKIGQLQWLPEIEDETNDSGHNSSKRRSRKADADDRILHTKDLESASDSS